MFLTKDTKSPFYQVVYEVDGKRIKKSIRKKSLEEAQKFLEQFEAEFANNQGDGCFEERRDRADSPVDSDLYRAGSRTVVVSAVFKFYQSSQWPHSVLILSKLQSLTDGQTRLAPITHGSHLLTLLPHCKWIDARYNLFEESPGVAGNPDEGVFHQSID